MSRVFELRQYALHPGKRQVLIDVFDREFVESQEAVGMEVIGQFRDLDRPDRFVWVRGFPDLAARHQALSAFYGGPVWAEHKDVANATMIDSDDVLLLRPLSPETTFPPSDGPRAPVGSVDQCRSLVTAVIYPLARPLDPQLAELFTGRIEPLLAQSGAPRLACLQTESAPNTYTRLPVREGEHVVVRIARFDDAARYSAHRRRLAASPSWRAAYAQLLPHLLAPEQHLLLQPTARSRIR